MLISVCTPVMNRTDDLKRVMNVRIDAAMSSLPVEFVILSYNSHDDLREFVVGELKRRCEAVGILLTYREYKGNEYYHQAHAYNLSVKSSRGEYICIMGADTYPKDGYFQTIRELAEFGVEWMEDKRFRGAVCVRRDVFDAVGGYDERFEFYGPEDRDLAVRLMRYGAKKSTISNLLGNNPTPDEIKVANYRVKGTKHELSKLMRPIFDENVRNDVVRVNPKGWGEWI